MAVNMARYAGFSESEIGKVALVVTEAGTNLVRHTRSGGEMFVSVIESAGHEGIEILVLDKGPGMASLAHVLRDGYSSAGGTGIGLGAIKRLSAFFDVYSLAGMGTALVAQLWSKPRPAHDASKRMEIGGVYVAMPGEDLCGDAWAMVRHGKRNLILVADGLGHGPLAAEASNLAVKVFLEVSKLSPKEIISALHTALRHTRGAAAAVSEVDLDQGTLRFAGIGNIAGFTVSSGVKRQMLSFNGTVGLEIYEIKEFTYPWPAGALLLMHSDGLHTNWTLEAHPGLEAKHPSLIAGVLYRDFNRGHDDVSVVVARNCDQEVLRNSEGGKI